MRYFLVILIFFLLTSCGTARFDTVTGKYRSKGRFEWGSDISLKKDSTFIYKWQTGFVCKIIDSLNCSLNGLNKT